MTTDYPPVEVTDITNLIIPETRKQPVQVNLGYNTIDDLEREINVSAVIVAERSLGGSVFLLKWVSHSKTPHGAIVAGFEISWIRNGMVVATNGKVIGTYDRRVEFGGKSCQEHTIIVYLQELSEIAKAQPTYHPTNPD